MATQKELTDQVLKLLGGLTKISKATGIPVTTISGWKASGSIPDWRRPALIDLAQQLGKDLPAEFLEPSKTPEPGEAAPDTPAPKTEEAA